MPHWSPFLDGGPLLSQLYLARRWRYRLSQRVVVDCPRNCGARDISFPRRCSGLSNHGSPGQVTLVCHREPFSEQSQSDYNLTIAIQGSCKLRCDDEMTKVSRNRVTHSQTAIRAMSPICFCTPPDGRIVVELQGLAARNTCRKDAKSPAHNGACASITGEGALSHIMTVLLGIGTAPVSHDIVQVAAARV
jgi:hypothetical protein